MVRQDFEPHSVVKIISRAKPEPETKVKHEKKSVSAEEIKVPIKNEGKANVNEMGIQMISKSLFEQIFRNSKSSKVDNVLIEK